MLKLTASHEYRYAAAGLRADWRAAAKLYSGEGLGDTG
jgi:hypothetical protein